MATPPAFLYGAANLRKVGAYTYQALLGLAAEKLRVPVATLTVTDGIVSGGGKSIRYGELVQDQQLDLKIPVSGAPAKVDPTEWNGLAGLDGLTVLGDPPTKPVSQYKVVGKSHPMPGIPAKVTGKTQWSCDVTLPGMLHARMVRPATLGSTLITVGALDKTRFPNAQVITKQNLVAVLSPNEWEAVSAARSVASGTKWSEWSGLPGSEHLTQTLRDYKWGAPSEGKGNAADVQCGSGAWRPKRFRQPTNSLTSNMLPSVPLSQWPTCAVMAQPRCGPILRTRKACGRRLQIP